MKLTPFGEAVRVARMRNGLTLKNMADAMSISSAYLSGIEYGEKRLSDKLINSALEYLSSKVDEEQLRSIRDAAEKSKNVVSTVDLSPDARGLVAAFARKLQQGSAPTPQILKWLNEQNKKGD